MYDAQVLLLVATFGLVALHLWNRHRRHRAFVKATLQLRAGDPQVHHDDAVENVTAYVHDAIRGGFEPIDSIREIAFERAEEDGFQGDAEAFVDGLIAEQLAARQAAERDWPAVTDCDRLDAAFATLEARGVVARQNFTCCQTCGHAGIQDEMENAVGTREVHGYAFFHEQDTESAIAGGDLYLAYGPRREAEGDTVKVGHEVCDALRDAGLSPDWDGDASSRIRLPLKWQRRTADAASVASTGAA